MTPDDKKLLLDALSALAAGEAENVQATFKRVFLPLPAHRLALRPEAVVVRGGRGAGKSALFKILQGLPNVAELRAFFEDEDIPDVRWVDAFSQGIAHPTVDVLDAFGDTVDASSLRAFWMGHLLHRLTDQIPTSLGVPTQVLEAWERYGTDVHGWVPVAAAHIGGVAVALDRAEAALEGRDQTVFAAYDHLDRIGSFKAGLRRRYIGTLLALWLSLANRYSRIRAKIFLRDDLFDAGELGFADASKLRARSVSIDWDVESLYRVVVRYMAEASPDLRTWLGKVRKGFTLAERPPFGWFPGPMPEDTQDAFATLIAGRTMGSGPSKGYTYRWIPNHLQDSQRRIVPRSMLNLIGFAAREAQRKPPSRGTRLLRTQNLVSALAEASKARVSEIKEEYPLVQRLEQLRGMEVLLKPEVVVDRVGRAVPGEEPDKAGMDGRAVLDELVRLGVLSVRTDGRIDVPDIYRSGFGIKRKGGAPRAR